MVIYVIGKKHRMENEPVLGSARGGKKQRVETPFGESACGGNDGGRKYQWVQSHEGGGTRDLVNQ